MIGQPGPLHSAGRTFPERHSDGTLISGSTELRQRGFAVIVVFMTIVSVVLACATAARRPLWYDELMTYHLVCQPDLPTFWRALTDGTDLNPPLHHLAIRALTPLLGHGPLALRLPSIVGFGLMVVCLYGIVRRHAGGAAAWVALLLPFTTRAYRYAFEARPYGLMMGFSALALYCWQSAAAGRRRPLALMGLALGLAAAISTHFYTVFVFGCLALGELARTRSQRRWDPPIWVALAVGAFPLALFRPVIAAARARKADFWSQPSLTKCFDFYSWLISTEAIFPLVLFGLVSICLVRIARRRPGPPDHNLVEPLRSMPVHECVAIVAFALIPFFVHVLALTVTNAFTERYALPAVIGISVMTAFLVDWRGRGRMAALLPALVLIVWVGLVQVMVYRRVTTERDAYSLLSRELERADRAHLPILVADARDYLQLHYKAPEPLASRLIFATGTAATRAESSSAGEIEKLGHWVELRIDHLGALEQAHPQFLVFGAADSGLVTSLAEPDSGSIVTARGPELYLVQKPRTRINTVGLQSSETRIAE